MGEFIGKWKLVDHKGLDIVLKALSVSEEELKNLIKHATLECSQPKNEHLRLNTNLPFFPGNAEFRIGEEFEQMWADQSTVKGIVEQPSPSKMIYTIKHPITRVVINFELLDKDSVVAMDE
ncbi:unnamed protein product [Calicophoron daubneyi]|uniref:Uncharacterized protein n=1 Tax=Calicophoron daubneyi TaxID=300641 RepID=A0AAV2TWF4_CALDB